MDIHNKNGMLVNILFRLKTQAWEEFCIAANRRLGKEQSITIERRLEKTCRMEYTVLWENRWREEINSAKFSWLISNKRTKRSELRATRSHLCHSYGVSLTNTAALWVLMHYHILHLSYLWNTGIYRRKRFRHERLVHLDRAARWWWEQAAI